MADAGQGVGVLDLDGLQRRGARCHRLRRKPRHPDGPL